MRFIIVLLILSSCLGSKENRQKRKADRLIKKAERIAPELFDKDTIFIRDTLVLDRTIIDTHTNIIYHDSTIIVNNEKVYARYFYDTLRQDIYHEIECKEQKVIYEKEVIHDVIKPLKWYEKLNINTIIIIILSILLLLFLLKKYSKIGNSASNKYCWKKAVKSSFK